MTAGTLIRRIPPRAAVLVAVLIAFLPSMPASVAPSHDALQIFTAYWTYVSGLVTEGHLPEWIPYSRYGTPSAPIFMYISPMAYLTGALGALMHIRDLLLLFKATVVLEYLVFAAGIMRLGKVLFESEWVAAFVAIAAVYSSPWILSLDGNFHAFYMTPWILAELAAALETGRGKHLGFAALLSIYACIGNVPYFPPFQLLQLFVFSLPLFWMRRDRLKPLLTSVGSYAWLALAVLAAAVHFLALVKGMEGLAIFSPGRDPVTNHVPKSVFLTYAGVAKPLLLLKEFVSGACTNGDNTFYMGLGTLVLAPLSMLVRPTPLLRAIQTLAVFVLLFSTGGLVASASYYFPGMVYYRHVSIVFGLFRLLLLLCAGYVLDRCIADPDAFSEWRTRFTRAVRNPLVLALAVLAAYDLTQAQTSGPAFQLVLVHATPFLDPVSIRIALYAFVLWLGRASLKRMWPAWLMAGLLLDLTTFWGIGWLAWPRLDPEQTATMMQLSTPRVLRDPGPRFTVFDGPSRGRLFRFVNTTAPLHVSPTAVYVHTYFWTGEDPCVPKVRTDFLAASVARFFDSRGVPFQPTVTTELKVLNDPVMATALACGHPRVTSPATIQTFARGYDWIRMTVNNPQSEPAIVQISEALHDGWTVRVDGTQRPLSPPYEAFLGVMVPPGRHELDFRFHLPLAGPLRTTEGFAAALAALGLLVASAWRSA